MSEDHVGLSSRKLVNCLIRWNSWLNSKVVSSPEGKEKTTQTSEKFLSFTVIYTLYWSATGKCKIWHFILNNFYTRTWPSAQVFCVSSSYPASFSCSTLDLHFNGNHVYIISPNLWKALLGWSQIAKPHMAPQDLPRAVEHLPTSYSCRTVITWVPQTWTLADHCSLLGMASKRLGLIFLSSEVCI